MPVLLKCPNCGAPLPEAEVNAPTARCPFCNQASRLADARRAQRTVPRPTSGPSVNVIVVALATVLLLTAAAVVLFSASRSRLGGSVRASREFGGWGRSPGLFDHPRALAVDGEGRIYVGDYQGGRIQAFDREGKFLLQWMLEKDAIIECMAADRNGRVYVPASPHGLREYDGKSGRLLRIVGEWKGGWLSRVTTTPDGGLIATGGVGDIVVLDRDRKLKLVVEQALIRATGENRSYRFQAVAVDGVGTIFGATSSDLASVFKFAPDGRFLNRFSGKGEGQGRLDSPEAIAIDARGRVHVADGRRLEIFDSEGTWTKRVELPARVDAMAIDDKQTLIVASDESSKVSFYPITW